MLKFAILLSLCVLVASEGLADNPTRRPALRASGSRACFQTIVVRDKHTGKIRQFTRTGRTRYGTWTEGTPVPRAVVTVYSIREWAVTPEAVKQVVGGKLFELMAAHVKVTQSGHFNLSGNADFDWANFGGDCFTTKDMAMRRLPIALIGVHGRK